MRQVSGVVESTDVGIPNVCRCEDLGTPTERSDSCDVQLGMRPGLGVNTSPVLHWKGR